MSTTEDRQGDYQVYELSYLLLPSIPEGNLSEVVTKIEKVIESKGGQKIDGEAPFLRELAYEMTKVVGASRYMVKNAYIGWTKFELNLDDENEAHPIEAIKAEIEKMQEVLRMLIIKAEKETKFTFASARLAKEAEMNPEESESEDSSGGEEAEDEGSGEESGDSEEAEEETEDVLE